MTTDEQAVVQARERLSYLATSTDDQNIRWNADHLSKCDDGIILAILAALSQQPVGVEEAAAVLAGPMVSDDPPQANAVSHLELLAHMHSHSGAPEGPGNARLHQKYADEMRTFLVRHERLLVHLAQLMDAWKAGDVEHWTEWDQRQRDELTALLLVHKRNGLASVDMLERITRG